MSNHKRKVKVSQEEVVLRRLSRQTQLSTRLKNFITYSVTYPIQDYISYNNIFNDHYTFLSFLSKIEEPTNYEVVKLTQISAKQWKNNFEL
jgi:hypothetical protein